MGIQTGNTTVLFVYVYELRIIHTFFVGILLASIWATKMDTEAHVQTCVLRSKPLCAPFEHVLI